MLKQLLAPQLVLLYILAASTIYVHFRGRERLRIARQLGDHSSTCPETQSLTINQLHPLTLGNLKAIH